MSQRDAIDGTGECLSGRPFTHRAGAWADKRGQTIFMSRVNAMLAAMITLAVLSQFFRSSNGVIAPEMMHELGIDAHAIGLSSGAFFVIFALLQIPIGVLFDRYGVRNVVSGMLVFAIVGSAIFAVASSLGPLVAGRFLIGLGFAGGMVGSLVVLSRWLDPSEFTRSMTILFASANIGSLLATSPLSAANELVGWRSTFLLLSVVTAVVAAAYFLVVRDERPGAASRSGRPETLGASIRGIGDVFRVPGLLGVLPLIALGYSSIVTIIGLWGGPYLHEVHGVDGIERGNLLSILAVAFVVGTLAYGPVQRRAGGFRRVVIGGAVATAALMLALAALADGSLPVVLTLLVATCLIGGFSVVLMGHGVALIPAALKGRGTTTLNGVLMGGTAILQIASGAVVEAAQAWTGSPSAGYAAFFLFLGVLTLAATALYLRTPEPRRDTRG